jgi:hypothetical protein
MAVEPLVQSISPYAEKPLALKMKQAEHRKKEMYFPREAIISGTLALCVV